MSGDRAPLEGIENRTLLALAELFEAGHGDGRIEAIALKNVADSAAAAEVLEGLRAKGASAQALAAVCRLIVDERDAVARRSPRVELVWTGLEEADAPARAAWPVFRDLCERARTSVVIASYSLGSGHELFEPLARRMAVVPALHVQMFFDVTVGHGSCRHERDFVGDERCFARRFRAMHWPWGTLPEVYCDARTGGDRARAFHAKCVIVDDEVALVTSANTSSAANFTNVEAGVRVEHVGFARELGGQFRGMVERGDVRRLAWP